MRKNNRNNNNNRRLPQLEAQAARAMIDQHSRVPKQIPGNVELTRTYRFEELTAGFFNVQAGDLLGIGGGICTTTNSVLTLNPIASKIHKVEMFAPPVPGTIKCMYTAAIANSYAKEFADSTNSEAFPAHVSCRPPKGSAADLQVGSGSSIILTLEVVAATIIDVHITHYMSDRGLNFTSSIAAGTVGVSYYLALDHSGTNQLKPVNLLTTT
mgnify:CR=1 FL=1